MTHAGPGLRSCLHCSLARALRAEAGALGARGLAVTLGRSEAVWLPLPGMRVYRALRRLLRAARDAAEHGPVKLTVIDLVGKTHVEVTACVPRAGGVRVVRVAFPRHVPGTLAAGFAESVGT
jgi:hypothetical protein